MKHFTILFLLAANIMLVATDSALVAQSDKRNIDPHSFLPPCLRHHQIHGRFPDRNTTVQTRLDAHDQFDPLIDRFPHDPYRDELNPMRRIQRRGVSTPAMTSTPFTPSMGLTGSTRSEVGSTFQSLLDSVQEAWVSHYSSALMPSDFATALAVDASGNVYVTGYSRGSGTYDYATVKYNASGVEQWVARYNGPAISGDYAYALAVDTAGNVYVTGHSTGSGLDFDYATVKYNASGGEQWVARYNGPGNDYDAATALAVDAAGNVYVTGVSWSSGTSLDYATVKYNASGVEQWVARYNGPGNFDDTASALAVDASGNAHVTGRSWGSGTSLDYATVKYNASGVQEWIARYNGPGNYRDEAYALAVDASSNVYVTGLSHASGTSYDYATVKYDAAGVQEWVARYNGPVNSIDRATALAVDESSNVYVTGWSIGTSLPDYDYATVKYNASGVEQWVARYNGPGNYIDWAYALAVDALGNVYVTGGSIVTSFPDYDYATVKYNATGVQEWVARYNGAANGDDEATALAVDASSNVYVTGWSDSSASTVYTTIKYIQIPTSLRDLGTGVPETFSLEQNYPNPFNPSTNFGLGIGGFGFVSLKVYDVLGNEVATLVNEEMRPGRYEVTWEASGMASGVYFYRLEAGSFSETKKLILLR